MKYSKIQKAVFKTRLNRFVAIVYIDGREESVHVKNTGRCRELLIPGAEVILSETDNPARRTRYDLIAAYKQGLGLVNIDSQAPNQVVKEWLLSQGFEKVQPEYSFGESRLDFYLEKGERKILIEVKGCTLEIDGIGYFPDAPTERGCKHLRELAKAAKSGYECYVAFVIQMPGVEKVLPNAKTDPMFEKAFNEAISSGVKAIYLPCIVTENELKIKRD